MVVDSPGVLVVGLAAVALGGYAGYSVRRYWSIGSQAESSDPVDVRQLRPGRVEVAGTVEPIDGQTSPEPFGTGACVLATWAIRQNRGDGTETLASGTFSNPFRVTDGSGTVTVDPAGDGRVIFDKRSEPPRRYRGREHTPEPIQQFEAAYDVEPNETGRLGRLTTRARTYAQNVLSPGDEVHVTGRARVAGQDADTRYLIESPEDPDAEFVISDLDEGTVGSLRWLALLGLVLAAGTVLGGLALLASVPLEARDSSLAATLEAAGFFTALAFGGIASLLVIGRKMD